MQDEKQLRAFLIAPQSAGYEERNECSQYNRSIKLDFIKTAFHGNKVGSEVISYRPQKYHRISIQTYCKQEWRENK